jgi:hypothetical protein
MATGYAAETVAVQGRVDPVGRAPDGALGGGGAVRRPRADPSVGLALEQCPVIRSVTDTPRTGWFVRFRGTTGLRGRLDL